MKAFVNENCIGCELCVSICPEVFHMTDEHVSKASDVIEAEQEDSVREAAASCPVSAIEVE